MQISSLKINNYRSLRSLEVPLEETTVFIGANNTGKSAVLEAIRVALSRRWGRRGTGFTEYDVHCREQSRNPKTDPPVQVELRFEETEDARWDPDMVAALDSYMSLNAVGRNLVCLRVTCQWDADTEAFEPAWEFLDAAGNPRGNRAARATNTSEFFAYARLFFLPALRDALDEFGARSPLWTSLLKSIRIPEDVETSVQQTLDGVDAQLLEADPNVARFAEKIGQAAKIAVGQSEGEARMRMMPMNTWDLISRASIVMKHESPRPWLPLDHHGQGLQSLSVIFLFQTAVFQQLQDDQPGTEPIFLLEEPEAHLHPQAARTLWEHVKELPGQKLVTTHSPYFVQHVPLHNLRLMRLIDGQSEVSFLSRQVVSNLPWNDGTARYAQHQGEMFHKDPKTSALRSTAWFDERVAEGLKGCYRGLANAADLERQVDDLRHACCGLITAQEEYELSFLGRRIRGEIFFARHWILVEGQSEYVLLHAIGRALNYSLDRHGVAVIDFQNNGAPDVYLALAHSFKIPWRMVTDGDGHASIFANQLSRRGFVDADLNGRLTTLPAPNALEDQLLADGHEARLRAILADLTSQSALTCPIAEFAHRLKNNKIPCISRLALQVEQNAELALQMPAALVEVVYELKAVEQ
jgi:putative ATP-dependent endonuclease of the OLD family